MNSISWKLLVFTIFIECTVSELATQNFTAKRSLQVAISSYPTWFEPCSFEKPITCKKPGASVETMWLLEKYYGANIDFTYYKGFGVGTSTETNTVSKGILDGRVQLGISLLYVNC